MKLSAEHATGPTNRLCRPATGTTGGQSAAQSASRRNARPAGSVRPCDAAGPAFGNADRNAAHRTTTGSDSLATGSVSRLWGDRRRCHAADAEPGPDAGGKPTCTGKRGHTGGLPFIARPRRTVSANRARHLRKTNRKQARPGYPPASAYPLPNQTMAPTYQQTPAPQGQPVPQTTQAPVGAAGQMPAAGQAGNTGFSEIPSDFNAIARQSAQAADPNSAVLPGMPSAPKPLSPSLMADAVELNAPRAAGTPASQTGSGQGGSSGA